MAAIYRAVAVQLDLAQSILQPRLVDNRFNGNEQAIISTALTEISRCRGMLPDTNVMDEAERQGCHDTLLSNMQAVAALELNKQLGPWEFYNALDLLNDAAANVLAGDAGSSSDL